MTLTAKKNKNWIDTYRQITRLDDQTWVGGATVEQRSLTDLARIVFDQQIYLKNFWDGPLHLQVPEVWSLDHVEGKTVSRFATGEMELSAYQLAKGCLGNNINQFRETILSRIDFLSLTLVTKNKVVNGTETFRLDFLAGSKDQEKALTFKVIVLFLGKTNDYLVVVERSGRLMGAGALTERLIGEVKIVEDPRTKTTTFCPNLL